MNSPRGFIRYTWFVLFLVFLVILAGGVVRMTQSGMGCPDWPTCFGKWIPPASVDQLPPDFEKYLGKQDIDHSFNAYHTWIEYINRLMGALLGVFIFIHFVWSYLRFRKTNRPLVLLSLLMLFAVGFQGWLGKKVVDANLAAVKVTTHMLVALLIAAIPVLIIYKLKASERIPDRFLKNASVILLCFLLVQIVLGTEVREQIDEIAKTFKYRQRELWIAGLDNLFIIHRSFSWLAAALAFVIFWKARVYPKLRSATWLIIIFVVFAILLGAVMNFLNIPAIAQPLHLLAASILTITVFAFRLRVK
jgi:cytochrome c oxidase assembly protein subunit 15